MRLLEALAEVPDPRRAQGRRHALPCVLMCMFMGTLSGCVSWRDHGDFVVRHSEALMRDLGVTKDRLPSYSTLRRVMARVDFDQLSAAFLTWARQHVQIEEGEWLAGDGKSLRGTVKNATDAQQNFISLVTLYAHKRGIAFESRVYENKGQSEAHVMETLLSEVDLQGAGVTLDSLHCRKKHAA